MHRRERCADAEEVARPWADTPPENVVDPGPARFSEDLVTSDAGEQRAAAGSFEKRGMKMNVEGPEQAAAA